MRPAPVTQAGFEERYGPNRSHVCSFSNDPRSGLLGILCPQGALWGSPTFGSKIDVASLIVGLRERRSEEVLRISM